MEFVGVEENVFWCAHNIVRIKVVGIIIETGDDIYNYVGIRKPQNFHVFNCDFYF
jgi:hypothetical protein